LKNHTFKTVKISSKSRKKNIIKKTTILKLQRQLFSMANVHGFAGLFSLQKKRNLKEKKLILCKILNGVVVF